VNIKTLPVGQFEIPDSVRRKWTSGSKGTASRAPESSAAAPTYRVSTAADIRRTRLRRVHQPGSARTTSMETTTALKWFGVGAGGCALIIASILSLSAIANGADGQSSATAKASVEPQAPNVARDPSVEPAPPPSAERAPLQVGARAPSSSASDFEIPDTTGR
jgi:hypothetical protein